jgi:CHASE3 domain sensor protein
MKDLLKENAIRIAIVAVFILIFIGAALSYYNRYTMSNALTVKKRSEAVLQEIDRIHDNIRFMDISARGYALIRKRHFLFWKVDNARALNNEVFTELDSLFEIQGLINPDYEKMKRVLHEYTNVFAKMVNHLEYGRDHEYLVMLEFDYGKSFYQTFTPFLDKIITFENKQSQEAQEQYEAAVARNRIVQLLLFIMGLPTLLWIFFKLVKDERERKKLLLNLETNNKQYLFDNGAESEREAKKILQTSIKNLQQASKFVGEISTGNYEVKWDGLAEQNENLNKGNLAGRLVMMRDEMKRLKEEDRKRIWTTQGLSELSEIIRNHQHNLNDLNWHALTFIVKYTASQQGGLFVLKYHHENSYYLELSACYAYERKKIIEKIVKIGEGLIGQAFLEGEPILLKKVPDQYLNITSGLGYATPDCLVIIPMKHNDKVQAVIELATFKEYLPYEIAFLEKAGSFIASAIFAAEQNEHNKHIMEKLQSQTEQLRAQEEELRQNIEELEATQENIKRTQVEVDAYAI